MWKQLHAAVVSGTQKTIWNNMQQKFDARKPWWKRIILSIMGPPWSGLKPYFQHNQKIHTYYSCNTQSLNARFYFVYCGIKNIFERIMVVGFGWFVILWGGFFRSLSLFRVSAVHKLHMHETHRHTVVHPTAIRLDCDLNWIMCTNIHNVTRRPYD